jgi:hypothetical protein
MGIRILVKVAFCIFSFTRIPSNNVAYLPATTRSVSYQLDCPEMAQEAGSLERKSDGFLLPPALKSMARRQCSILFRAVYEDYTTEDFEFDVDFVEAIYGWY